jgi:hypothetical protein
MSKEKVVILGYISYSIAALCVLIRAIRTGIYDFTPLEWTAPVAFFFFMLGCIFFVIAILKIK